MRLAVLAFVAGAWLLQQQAGLPHPLWALLPLPALAAAALAQTRPALRGAGRSLAVAGWFAAGFMWAALLAHWRLADALPVEWEGADLLVTGVVAGLPQANERGTRFEFDVESVQPPAAQVPARVSLAWYGRPAGEEADAPRLRAGERWQLAVRLKRPHGNANPHGFDYEAWLLERGIRATGSVRPRGDNRRLDALAWRPAWLLHRAREAVRERFVRALGDAPEAGVLVALAIGDQRAIPPERWQLFTRTGVNHLMSISGLHITMVSSLVFALAWRAWRRSRRLAERLPAQKAAALAGLAAALGYALLAGFGVPAQRTLLMLAVVAAALWLARLPAASTVLAAAAAAVVVADPWAVSAPGFWLSFGAVAIIFYVSAGREGPRRWWWEWARVQGAITLGLVPPLVAMFGQVSLVSPLANAFAIPAVSLVVVPLTLLAVVLPWDGLLWLAHAVTHACIGVLGWLAAAPEAVWAQQAPAAWTVAAALVGVALLLAPRGFPGRWVGAVWMLPMFVVSPPLPEPGTAQVAVLDVGQGTAVVVRTRQHALLYDAGPEFAPGADAGERVVVPFLRGEGIRRLDGMVVSHDDLDHAGGAASVLQALPVGWLASSLEPQRPLMQARGARACYAGQQWEWDGVRFEMLHPPLESYGEKLSHNARSCVLKVIAGGQSILLTGDVGGRTEDALAARAGPRLAATYVLAPHHGSASSSRDAFVAAAAPAYAVVSAGWRNRFGHPRPEVVRRYAAQGAQILRTDQSGALLIALGTGAAPRGWRGERRRYWQER